MLERIESPAAPTGAALYPTPGQETFLTTDFLEPRGGISVAGRTFVVIGTAFFEIFSDGTKTQRGTIASDTNPATISYNGTAGGHLFITSGSNGYNFVLATNVLTTVLTNEATMGGMINSRFLAFNRSNGQVRLSALNDGTTWDPTLFFQRSQAADPWQCMIVNPPEIWLLGEHTGEVWYDTGAFPQPFAPIPGAFFKYGITAPFAGGVAGDYVTWVSKGKDGGPTIVAARGFTPQAISPFSVNHALAGFQRDASLSDAEVLVYEDGGHLLGCYTFPTARSTWCVDFSMDMAWHERGRWDAAYGRYDIWGPRMHVYAFNTHLVGNRGSNGINVMDVTFGAEANGDAIRRLRIPPPLWANSRQRLQVSRLQVMVEPGLGLTSGQGSDPQVMLRTSPDAKTWSSERMASAGALGNYQRRVFWHMLGSSDALWVPEITCTDPIPWRLSGAEIDGSGFQQARAA